LTWRRQAVQPLRSYPGRCTVEGAGRMARGLISHQSPTRRWCRSSSARNTSAVNRMGLYDDQVLPRLVDLAPGRPMREARARVTARSPRRSATSRPIPRAHHRRDHRGGRRPHGWSTVGHW